MSLYLKFGFAKINEDAHCGYCERPLNIKRPIIWQETAPIFDKDIDNVEMGIEHVDILTVCGKCQDQIIQNCEKFKIPFQIDPEIYRSSASAYSDVKDH